MCPVLVCARVATPTGLSLRARRAASGANSQEINVIEAAGTGQARVGKRVQELRRPWRGPARARNARRRAFARGGTAGGAECCSYRRSGNCCQGPRPCDAPRPPHDGDNNKPGFTAHPSNGTAGAACGRSSTSSAFAALFMRVPQRSLEPPPHYHRRPRP